MTSASPRGGSRNSNFLQTLTFIYPIQWIVFLYAFVSSILPQEYGAFLSFAIVLVGFVEMAALKKISISPEPLFVLFATAQIFAMSFHPDLPSWLNAGSTLLIFSSLYLIVWKALRMQGLHSVETLLYRTLVFVGVMMFPVSSMLTAYGVSTAPDRYFWQADPANGKRLLLMQGGGGHSPIIWVTCFALLLNEKLCGEARRGSSPWLGKWLLRVVGTAILIFSGTRIGLLILGGVGIYSLCRRRRTGGVWVSAYAIGTSLIFGYIALSPGAAIASTTWMNYLQGELPFLHISTESSSARNDPTANRAILNQSYIAEVNSHPWSGEGHTAPILLSGVRANGQLANSEEEKSASGESIMPVAVAYGYPYLAAVLIFIAWPMLRSLFGKTPDRTFACAVSGMVLLITVTEGAFAQWYTDTLLFAVITILYSIAGDSGLMPNGYGSRACY